MAKRRFSNDGKLKLYTPSEQLDFESVKDCGIEAVHRFIDMVRKGESVKMAAMLASRKAPSSGFCDQLYQRGRVDLLQQCYGSKMVMEAWQQAYRRKHGEDLPSDAVIHHGLAKTPYDTDCIQTHKRSMQDILSTAKEHNLQIEGDVDIESRSADPVVQEVRMRDDLVEKYVEEYIAEEPEYSNADRQEIREMVIDKHSAPMATPSSLAPMGATNFKELSNCIF